MSKENIKKLKAEFQRDDAYPLVVTGAGISVASGIPTFRGSDPDAIWSNDVMEMGTFGFFLKNPVAQWKWYLSRFTACLGAKPNAAHKALVDIQGQISNLQIVTQNIDGLHIEAGSQGVIEIHGRARKLRCSNWLCDNGGQSGSLDWDDNLFVKFKEDPNYNTLPRCPKCNEILRAHVLWFDEGYYDHDDYGMEEFQNLAGSFTSIVFIGTSLSVGITDAITVMGVAGELPMFIIDPHLDESPEPEIKLIKMASEDLLPQISKSIDLDG